MARSASSRPLALILFIVMVLPALTVAMPAEAEEEHRLNDGFHSFAEIEAKMRSLAENNSDIAVLYDLGELYPNGDGSTKTSHEGRHFWALKISDDPLEDDPDEPEILYVGLHHGREWMTTEMMVWLMEHILADYGTNDTITQIVDTRELWLFPIQNPDGFVYTETDDRTWRKNRRNNGNDEWGVDPNRNYGYKWGYDDIGSEPDPGDELYRGPYPFSEPCTQIVRDLAFDIGFNMSISFHTYSEVMVWAPAYKRDHATHYPLFKELGRRMNVHNGYDYGDVADGILYTANGAFDDFMYFNTSCLSFTYEMNSLAQGGFYTDASLIEPTCSMNYEAALELAKAPADLYQMFDGGIQATVKDPRGEPLEGANVTVELLAGDTLDFVTGPNGRFSFHAPYERFYPITVTKEGYTSHMESHQVLWRDRLTMVNITIKDNVAPSIHRVVASHEGQAGTEFGIGQQVRIDLREEVNESGLQGVVSIESFGGQYFHRRKALTWDVLTTSYHYMWDTNGLKPRNDYLVTTELWDVDENRDMDGVMAGEPDLTLTLRDITPPMVPADLTLEAPPGGGSLIVSWEANSDDTESYTLQRRLGLDGTWIFLINLTRDDTSFTDQGLENTVPYAYRLMAWDKVPLPSTWSEVVTGIPRDLIPPSMVGWLAINAPSEGGVLEISWDEVTEDAAVYVLFRDTGLGFEVLKEFPRGTLMYVDRDVENDKSYFYKISARDASGNEGPPSISLLGMPLDVTAPGPPVVEPMPELTNLPEHQVSGTAEPNSIVVAMVNQEEVEQYEVGSDGTFKGKLELDNGINRVSFKCLDPSSNPSVPTEPMLVQVDMNPPYVTSSIPAPDQLEVPVTGLVSLMTSEGLVDGTVIGRLEIADTGVKVPASISYSTLTKTITVTTSTQLEKGTRYRVVVDGNDPAGNHLTGGNLSFTTERAEEPEPALGSSMLLAIVLLVLVAVVVTLFLVIRMRRPPSIEREGEPGWEPGPTDRPEAMPEYDPRTPDSRETYDGPGWEEY